MANSAGGCWLPNENQTVTGGFTLTGGATITGGAIVDPTVTLSAGSGSFGDRVIAVDAYSFTGAALAAANLTAWTAPADAVILRVWLNITTPSSGASTVDVGYTAVSATTTSDTLLDGVSGTPAALFDSMNAALDTGTNAKAQLAASGKWITIDQATGDVTGMVATLYVQYVLV